MHEAMYDETSTAAPVSPYQKAPALPPSNEPRFRSMSMSLPWRQRRRSSFLNMDEHILEKSKSHESGDVFDNNEPSASTRPDQNRNVKGMLRRASITLKSGVMGLVNRRTSVPARRPSDFGVDQLQHFRLPPAPNANARPTTAHATWRRVRQAASFHRQSRMLHTGYGDRPFDLDPIESPTFPVPGSGEQPPIIPRNTGAAARQAAASAYHHAFSHGVVGLPLPKPGWLETDVDLSDHESGIGIALTSTEMEQYVPSDEVDSDVDVGMDGAEDLAHISKVDFVSRLPAELGIQILAQLDASALTTASRVSRNWREIVANQHIWRESFLREKTTTYATSGYVKPGAGLGVPAVHPSNDWKEIYRVKTELDKRWEEGKVRPVYLNGHSDSIYCLQFDE